MCESCPAAACAGGQPCASLCKLVRPCAAPDAHQCLVPDGAVMTPAAQPASPCHSHHCCLFIPARPLSSFCSFLPSICLCSVSRSPEGPPLPTDATSLLAFLFSVPSSSTSSSVHATTIPPSHSSTLQLSHHLETTTSTQGGCVIHCSSISQ